MGPSNGVRRWAAATIRYITSYVQVLCSGTNSLKTDTEATQPDVSELQAQIRAAGTEAKEWQPTRPEGKTDTDAGQASSQGSETDSIASKTYASAG